MRGHLMPLSLFSTWHSANFLKLYDYLTVFFTFVTKLLEGLKDGIKCSGMMMVVFFEILRAVFSALRLITKLDRKSTRLNSSHVRISYAVFCLKKKNTK